MKLTLLNKRPKRPGFTVAEASLALALCLVGSALVVSLALVGMKLSLRLDEDRVAREELNNLQERSYVAGAPGITPDWVKAQKVGPAAMARLGNVALEVKLSFVDPQTGKAIDDKAAQAHFPRRVDSLLTWQTGAPRGQMAKKSGEEPNKAALEKNPSEHRQVKAWWILAASEGKAAKSTGGGT